MVLFTDELTKLSHPMTFTNSQSPSSSSDGCGFLKIDVVYTPLCREAEQLWMLKIFTPSN